MNAELIKKIQNMPGVKLVAVSNKHTKAEVDEMAALGVDTFGENRVQEFLEKYDPAYHWHIIGHLQTNKVKYIVGKVDLIESVDSREIEKQAAKAGIVQDILIEIKVSKTDENKTGLPEEELPELLAAVSQMPHLRLKGLMTIATQTDDQQLLAQEFDHMKNLFDQIQKDFKDADTLSMGMSSDYELAVAHGSNQVRIGMALFS